MNKSTERSASTSGRVVPTNADVDKGGGPAFPHVWEIEPPEGAYRAHMVEHGLSLRDYFAAAVLTSLIGSRGQAMSELSERTGMLVQSIAAQTAYAYADAMLAERNKTGGSKT